MGVQFYVWFVYIRGPVNLSQHLVKHLCLSRLSFLIGFSCNSVHLCSFIESPMDHHVWQHALMDHCSSYKPLWSVIFTLVASLLCKNIHCFGCPEVKHGIRASTALGSWCQGFKPAWVSFCQTFCWLLVYICLFVRIPGPKKSSRAYL